MKKEEFECIEQAVAGDKEALETLICSVQDLIYNLSLRMLGSPQDAQDATQEIIIRIITKLSAFRKESAFSTWVYRISTNYLINYKKTMFAQHPLSFDQYAQDIQLGFLPNNAELLQNIEEARLAEELKASCTNVMLQCLDPESRCIYVLGVMFKADSKLCAEILGISPEAYRQRLSRIRKKVHGFLQTYCGLSGSGQCNCEKRIGHAIVTHRLDPVNLEYSNLEKINDGDAENYIDAMEEMDHLSDIYAKLPQYKSPLDAKEFLENIMNSEQMKMITKGNDHAADA